MYLVQITLQVCIGQFSRIEVKQQLKTQGSLHGSLTLNPLFKYKVFLSIVFSSRQYLSAKVNICTMSLLVLCFVFSFVFFSQWLLL